MILIGFTLQSIGPNGRSNRLVLLLNDTAYYGFSPLRGLKVLRVASFFQNTEKHSKNE